ncbi:MAG: acyltransferase family protein [Clostridia bacterium]|nr:acyltransferase family protein [Clostridia bacterium]
MKKRIDWIDRIKGIGFYFVILGHMQIGKTLKSWIYSFHMPLFLIASGLNFNTEKIYSTKTGGYILKLIRRMLIPYMCMQLFSLAIRYVFSTFFLHKKIPVIGYIKGIFAANSILFKSPSDPSYFIILLFIAQIILFFLIKLFRGNRTAVLCACILLVPLSLITAGKPMLWHINAVPVTMFFIMLGTYLMDIYRFFEDKIQKSSAAAIIPVCAVLTLCGFLLWRVNGRFSLHANSYGKSFFLAVPCAVLTCCGLALFCMKLPKIKLIEYIGMNTLFYLGMHRQLIWIADSIFGEYKTNTVYIAITSAVIYFGLVPFVALCSKYAPFVLGQSLHLSRKMKQ